MLEVDWTTVSSKLCIKQNDEAIIGALEEHSSAEV